MCLFVKAFVYKTLVGALLVSAVVEEIIEGCGANQEPGDSGVVRAPKPAERPDDLLAGK